MAGVRLHQASKRYDQHQVIHGIDLEVDQGEFCVFVGPSGCGKSTLLRMIAGLEETSAGNIHIGERDVTRLEPAQRGVAMVFQNYALYPHMTVRENMGFGLKMNGCDRKLVASKVEEAAQILRLQDYLERKPKALSGGQRQRVAIGRAIVRGPEVFLFDEPLSNLDAELRVEMRFEIARLHQELKSTMVYVTHDQVEAMTLADKMVVLRNGRIEQVGPPMEIYNNPQSRFVAGFIGSPAMNFVRADCTQNCVHSKLFVNNQPPVRCNHNGELLLGIRPEHLELVPGEKQLKVAVVEKLGNVSFIYAQGADGQRLVIETKGEPDVSAGTDLGVRFDPNNAFLFNPESEGRIERVAG